MVNENCAKICKGLQIVFPWFFENFSASFNLFENAWKLQKNDHFLVEKN